MAAERNPQANAPGEPEGARQFSIATRYLNGWAMATHPTDRERAEWPPHPDRLFMALVAAAGEEAEFDEALRWLERKPAAHICASGYEQRSIVTSYVPVNDTTISRGKKGRNEALLKKIMGLTSLKSAKENGLALMPEHRPRYARPFPVAIPHEAVVHFIYNVDAAFTPNIREKLAALCARVVRVGHSASQVQCWLDFNPPRATLVPADGAAPLHLRVPSPGRLQYLRDLYELNQQHGTDLRPTPGLWAGYKPVSREDFTAPTHHSVFDPAFLLLRPAENERRRPPLVSTLRLTETLRKLLMSDTRPEDIPEALSGHTRDGRRLERPHLAIVPLPFVGYAHADGSIMGMALMSPRKEEDTTAIARALGRKLYTDNFEPKPLCLKMGDAGTWTLEATDDFGWASLNPQTWTATPGGAHLWATVTPIVLDHHPKPRHSAAPPDQIKATIAESCQRVGLPRPAAVEVDQVSLFTGVPHARDFPPLRRKDGSAPNYTHAVLAFDEPVVGPVLLGAGRYRGYGLCRPVRQKGGAK